MVPIEGIIVEQKNNNRFGTYTEDDLKDLLGDIESGKGIEMPVICRPAADRRPILVQGYRRYASVKLWNSRHKPSEAKFLPVILRDMNDEEALESNVIENVNRRSLTPMDSAVGIRNLTNAGRTEDEIASIYRKSTAWVSQTRKLLSLDKSLQKKVHESGIAGTKGGIPGSAGIELADIDAEYRGIVVATIENSYNGRFSTTNIRKAGREIGAFGDGVTQNKVEYRRTDPMDLLASSHTRGHTPKRKQRTVREQNDYWDKWEMDPRLTVDGQAYAKLQLGFISGKVTDEEMDKYVINLYNTGRADAQPSGNIN